MHPASPDPCQDPDPLQLYVTQTNGKTIFAAGSMPQLRTELPASLEPQLNFGKVDTNGKVETNDNATSSNHVPDFLKFNRKVTAL